MAEKTISRRSRGIDRAFEILDFLRLKREPMRPNEIAAEIGAPRSSVYDLVNILLRHHALEYYDGDGRVFLGRRLHFLGTAYAERFDLMREAAGFLLHLAEATRETAQLCVLAGNKYTVALMKEGIRPFRISSAIGEPVPIPWTASGRLLVSRKSDAEIGAPRSSVYDLVNILLRHHALEYYDGDGRVFLGRRLHFLGTAYAERFDLMREASGFLLHLAEATRETAQLCVLAGNKYTVALMKEGIRPFRISSAIGEPVPIPWTASGRLLVSRKSDAEIVDFIPEDDFVLPDGTRLEPSLFIEEVREATRVGYFTFDSVVESFTHCMAVPVYDASAGCVATLCLVTPREDGLRNRASYLASLGAAAEDLSARLGHPGAAWQADQRHRRLA